MEKYAPNGQRIHNPSTGNDSLVIDFVQYVLDKKREKNTEKDETKIEKFGKRGKDINSTLLGTEILSIPAPNNDVEETIEMKKLKKLKTVQRKVENIKDMYEKKEIESKVVNIQDIYHSKESKEDAR